MQGLGRLGLGALGGPGTEAKLQAPLLFPGPVGSSTQARLFSREKAAVRSTEGMPLMTA